MLFYHLDYIFTALRKKLFHETSMIQFEMDSLFILDVPFDN